MNHIKKSTIVNYTAKQMFDLVADVEQYPHFLPWCNGCNILQTNSDGITAKVDVAVGAIKNSFTTKNEHQINEKITMRLVKGPFSKLYGEWIFEPLTANSCKVSIDVVFGFDNFALSMVLGPIFNKIVNSLMDSFILQAKKIY